MVSWKDGVPSECPFCQVALSGVRTHSHEVVECNCPRCSSYWLSRSFATELQHRVPYAKRQGATVSFALRHMDRSVGNPLVTSQMIDRLLSTVTLPTPAEQADRCILWLGEAQQGPGDAVELNTVSDASRLGAIDSAGVHFLLSALVDSNLVRHQPVPGPKQGVMLSFSGWQRFETLKKGSVLSRRAFMAMAYSNLELDAIYREHFRPAVRQTGFELQRLDDNPSAGLIDARMRVEIRIARFVVVDLTDANAGAYWEAGFAEGLSKPVIYTCRRDVFESRGTHFDTSHHHTIRWTPEEPRAAADELKATIRATLPAESHMQD